MEGRQTIWVVEQGQYSDRHVVAVCSTQAHAEAIKAEWPEECERASITISEWVVDRTYDYFRNTGERPYTVTMLQDGTVEEVREVEKDYICYWSTSAFVWFRSRAKVARSNMPDCITGTVWARDETHAIKIMNERRAQSIVNGEWEWKER